MIEDINIPIEHLNNSDAPFNTQDVDIIKYPRVISEDLLEDDEDSNYWTDQDGEEYEI